MADLSTAPTCPLSPGQLEMWLDSLVHPASGVQIEQLVCDTSEVWDGLAWGKAWEHVVVELPVLRTVCSSDAGGEPRQWVAAQAGLMREHLDWRELPEGEQAQRWERWLEADRLRSFPSGAAPWLRVSEFRLSSERVRWVWTFHHVLLDGRSILLVLELLFASYDAFRAGRKPPVAAGPGFADFIVWLGPHWEQIRPQAEAYWQQQFSGLDSLPVAEGRQSHAPAALGPRAQVELELDESETAALHAASQASGVTMHTLCLGAWALALARSEQTEDIVVGVVHAGRRQVAPGAEATVGVLMNTLPVRVKLCDETPLVDWLKELRRAQIARRPFEQSPLSSIRRWTGWQARSPMFEALLVFERYELPREFERRWGAGGQRRFRLLERSSVPLILSAADGERLRLTIIHDTVRFTAPDISILRQYLRSALAAIGQHPARRIGALDLMAPEESAALSRRLTGPVEVGPGPRRLHQWVEAVATRRPEGLAIIGPDGTFTYGRLRGCGRHVQHALRRQGVSHDHLVGVCLPRSGGLLAAILGISMQGAAYLPLDGTLPAERLRELVLKASPVVILTDAATRQRLPPEWNCLVLRLEDQDPAADLASVEPPLEYAERNLAYAIFTSGTSGGPKLVGVEDRQIAHLLHFATRHVLREEDVRWVPFVDAIASDACLLQIFGTLALGGTLVALPDLPSVWSSVYADRWTCIGSTPSVLGALLAGSGLPPAIRLVGLGAEIIPQPLLESLRRQPQVQRIVNYYGPTETTVFSTLAWVWRRSDPEASGANALPGRVIGRPIANTRIYLLDGRGHWVPEGRMGELWIAGEGVARGYLNASAADHERFRADPFAGGGTARMYRTGDLARLLPDGQLEFLGRRDEQVKLRGFRIELGEIEAAMERCPGVIRAVVVLQETPAGEKRLASFFQATPGRQPTQEALLAQLRERLPAQMVPSACIHLERLPLTPTGKVDRRALPLLKLGSSSLAGHRVPPRNALEAQVAQVWRHVLELDDLGVHDNFFDCGGHSLLAVRLVAELELRVGAKLSVASLVQAPTIALLAEHLAQQDRQLPWRSLVPLQPHGSQPPVFFLHGWGGDVLSYMSLRAHWEPDRPAYGVQAVGLDGREPRHRTVEQMAAHYLREVRMVQPEGPYYLAGHSLGGIMAYELAQQLQAQGQRVALLALLDSGPLPARLPFWLSATTLSSYLSGRLAFHCARLCQLPRREWRDYLKGRWAALQFWLPWNRPAANAIPAQSATSTPPQLPGFPDYYVAVASHYRIRPYPGTMDLIVCADARLWQQAAWNHLVRGGVTRHRVAENHLELFDAGHVAKTVHALKVVICNRQAENPR